MCDCDGDDTLEIYYTVLMTSDKYDTHVRVLQKHRAIDNLFLKQRSFDADRNFRDILITEVTGKGKEELIINSGPSILDPQDLEVIASGPLKNIKVQSITDIDCDASNGPEIVATKNDSLYILDKNLNIISTYQTEYGAQIRHVKHFQSPFGKDYLGLLVTTVSEGIPNSVLYSMEVRRAESQSGIVALWRAYRLFWPTIIIVFILGMPAGIILYRSIFHRSSQKEIDNTPYESLLSILSSFDHGQMAGKNLNRLAFLFGNLPETMERIKEIRPNIEAALNAYHTFTQGQLAEIVKHAVRFKALKVPADKLRQTNARLEAIIRDISLSDLNVDRTGDLRGKIPALIDEIKASIKDIKNFIERQFATNLSDVFYKVFSLTAARVREQSAKFNICLNNIHSQRLVFFMERELIIILEELISNSIAAMESAEQKIIRINLTFGRDEAILDVTDTGHGLQAQDPTLLFSRDYSTKKDGGFGLYYIQQQCGKFGAAITIFNNDNGPGATARIRLKAVADG